LRTVWVVNRKVSAEVCMAGAFAVLFFIGLVILFFLSGVGNEPKVPPRPEHK
jgi:hypothetical protein